MSEAADALHSGDRWFPNARTMRRSGMLYPDLSNAATPAHVRLLAIVEAKTRVASAARRGETKRACVRFASAQGAHVVAIHLGSVEEVARPGEPLGHSLPLPESDHNLELVFARAASGCATIRSIERTSSRRTRLIASIRSSGLTPWRASLTRTRRLRALRTREKGTTRTV